MTTASIPSLRLPFRCQTLLLHLVSLQECIGKTVVDDVDSFPFLVFTNGIAHSWTSLASRGNCRNLQIAATASKFDSDESVLRLYDASGCAVCPPASTVPKVHFSQNQQPIRGVGGRDCQDGHGSGHLFLQTSF